jgi:hypothetical protein
MCNHGNEDLPHFLIECNALEECRKTILPQLITMFDNPELNNDRRALTIEILNCGPDLKTSACPRKKEHRKSKVLIRNPCMCVKKANLASLLCLKLHNKRNDILYEKSTVKKKKKSKSKEPKSKESVQTKVDKCIQCRKGVSEEDKAICCDSCNQWQHVTCKKIMTNKTYDTMQRYNISIPWTCKNCEIQ